MDFIREAANEVGATDVSMSGEAINSAVAQGSSDFEIQLILVMAVIVILGLLLITSGAWFEPVLFLSVIGISIVYNLGTNIIFGEISFITQMCAAVLQLAVSMDYGIVMLHAFRGFKAQGLTSYDAAVAAMHKAAAVIASSAATTFFRFSFSLRYGISHWCRYGCGIGKGNRIQLPVRAVFVAYLGTFERKTA